MNAATSSGWVDERGECHANDTVSHRSRGVHTDGIAAVSDDEQQYEQGLKKTVAAILEKFPAASGKVALAHSGRAPA